jgi:ribosomal protein S18 acetylase RimI-like enzyme
VRTGPLLGELTAERFTAELDALTGIYALAMHATQDELPGRLSIMERHAGYPGFRAVVAVLRGEPGEPVGFAYGFHGTPGQWWHDLVRDSLVGKRGSEAAAFWLDDPFEIAEVHVHPAHQGRGTGRAMMEHLAAGRPERTALLSTPEGHSRARRLYRSLGFTDLLPGFIFPGAGPCYAIMGVTLPLPGPPPDRPDRSASPSRW